jgi:hypothetical protein
VIQFDYIKPKSLNIVDKINETKPIYSGNRRHEKQGKSTDKRPATNTT